MSTQSSIFVSVVARVRNDATIIEPYVTSMAAILRANYENYELVIVDDGSDDDTAARIAKLLPTVECVRLLRLSRTFGDDIAFTAGLETAIGDWVVTMRPDTDAPELVPQLVELAKAKNAIVFGVNQAPAPRGAVRKGLDRLFHWSARSLFDVPLTPNTTQLRGMSRQAVNALVKVKDKYRSLRALTPFIGFTMLAFPYTPQRGNASRVGPPGFWQSLDTAINLLVANSTKPLRLVARLGLLASVLNAVYMLYVLGVSLFKPHVAEGWITLSTQNGVMFFLLFLILFVLTEYVGRILEESRDRPLYYVREELQSSVVIAAEHRRNVVRESA